MADIKITFKGMDYSRFSSMKTEIKYIKDNNGNVPENIKPLLDDTGENLKSDIKEILLEKFLEKNSKKISENICDGSKNNQLYNYYNNALYFDGVVGVIKKKDYSIALSEIVDKEEDDESENDKLQKITCDITVQIQSRMDVDEKKGMGKPYFLSTMLLKNKINFNNDNVPSGEEEIMDYLLLFWFKNQLQEAFLKGFYRTYRRFENNDNRLKGCIDIARHIRLNMGQDNGKIAYSYRENTVNNYLNHLIIAAYEHLKKKYYDIVVDNFDNNMELKSIIDNLRTEIGYSEYGSYQLIMKNLQSIAHPYYTEYEALRKTCLRILRDEGLSLFDGDGDDIEGILFYLPDLWEEYLQENIENEALGVDGINLKAQDNKTIFGFLKDTNKNKWEYKQDTRPDYVFYDVDTPFFILDAKFKPIWANTVIKPTNIPRMLDDYDKAIRDMVTINAYAAGVIFPMYDEEVKTDQDHFMHIMHRISDDNKTHLFYTIPVKVPYVKDDITYNSWKEGFDEQIKDSMNCVQKIIKLEYDFYKIANGETTTVNQIKDMRNSIFNSWCF